MFCASVAALLLSLQAAPDMTPAGEQPVAPYAHANANADGVPFRDDHMWRAFHGAIGVARVIDGMIDRSLTDPRISDIFKGQDITRLRRTLREQFCYLLGGGCTYTGRTMQEAHRNMGIQSADLAALVEHLQAAMQTEHIAFTAQNRLLAKLAPMKRDVVKQK